MTITRTRLKSYTELTAEALTAGRAFDGMAAGTFTDMHGREVTISAADFPLYVHNTKAAIAATRGESGELAGLPIDAKDHDKGDGAGWIVDVFQEGERLRFVPQWTTLGRELVGQKIRRMFSPTVDLENKVILGGTLTNWPATRSPLGHVLLRPIELSEQEKQLMDGEQIKAAFAAMIAGMDMPEPSAVEVYDDHVVATIDGAAWKIPFTTGEDGAVMFAPREQWEAKEQAEEEPAPMQEGANLSMSNKPTSPPADLKGITPADLAAKLAELENSIRAQVVAELTAKHELTLRQTATTDLCQRLTNGTPEAPRALKNVKPAELQKRLMSLPADDYAYFSGLLQGVVKDGLVEFAELGSGRKVQAKKQLPAEYAPAFERALKAGNTPEAFFKLTPELGSPAEYDLSKYQGKEK